MPYTTLNKLRILLGDPAGVWLSGGAELEAHLDRGRRDLGRRGLANQQRQALTATSGSATVTLPSDHVQTFAVMRAVFQVCLRLLDQNAVVWWFCVDAAGQASFSDTQPAGSLALFPNDVYWVQLTSADSTVWYVYPHITGELLTDNAQPGVGTGTTQIPQVRDPLGIPWTLGITNAGELTLSNAGSPTVAGDVLDPQPLHRIEPEAIPRADPRSTSGVPEFYALLGKTLLLHPTPDQAYQLVHYYFSDLSGTLPDAWQYVPVPFALSLELHKQGRRAAAGQVLQMYRAELEVLGLNLHPGQRDGTDLYRALAPP